MRAEKRRMEDRKYITFDWEEHGIRAFAFVTSQCNSWDLFPPLKGYRPFSAKSKRNYNVSIQRQLTDWAKEVKKTDFCQLCNKINILEAHHIWSRNKFPQLQYITKNGIPLCKNCHDKQTPIPEITFKQFKKLTSDISLINENIAKDDFWILNTAGLAKGRIIAYNLLPFENSEFDITNNEYEWFLEHAKLNHLLENIEQASNHPKLEDNSYVLNQTVVNDINNFQTDCYFD